MPITDPNAGASCTARTPGPQPTSSNVPDPSRPSSADITASSSAEYGGGRAGSAPRPLRMAGPHRSSWLSRRRAYAAPDGDMGRDPGAAQRACLHRPTDRRRRPGPHPRSRVARAIGLEPQRWEFIAVTDRAQLEALGEVWRAPGTSRRAGRDRAVHSRSPRRTGSSRSIATTSARRPTR